MTKMRALWFLIAIGCGGSKAPPSNTATGSPAPVTAGPDDSECMGGGKIYPGGAPAADCKYWGELMGPPMEGGGITMLQCCYPALEAACTNTGGCAVADCTPDQATPAKVTCKDTTHGGVPTNP
jgi:hypothetical protein